MARRVAKSIREIQQMDIADEEIFYLVEEMAQQHQERDPGEVDWHTAIGILAERYQQDHRRCFCIMERMWCFLPLLGDERMKGWTIKGIEEGCLLTNAAIFRAVAKCTLKADLKRAWFDPDEFFKIALFETESAGMA